MALGRLFAGVGAVRTVASLIALDCLNQFVDSKEDCGCDDDDDQDVL
jgi:hypothetical protein